MCSYDLVSWYNMLKRRKKLKKTAVNLETFATAHANSICRMLVHRFPSLVGDSTAPLADQAMSVLDAMGFVGFQCHYDEHLPSLLEWMRVPICTKTLGVRHNTAKRGSSLTSEDQQLLSNLNEQDIRLYEMAYLRYGQTPLHPERRLQFSSFASTRLPPLSTFSGLSGHHGLFGGTGDRLGRTIQLGPSAAGVLEAQGLSGTTALARLASLRLEQRRLAVTFRGEQCSLPKGQHGLGYGQCMSACQWSTPRKASLSRTGGLYWS